MSTAELQAKQQAELHSQLWAIANDLRGNMDASEFKNYILGLIFYRYLSDNLEKKVAKILEDDEKTFEEAWNDDEMREDLIEELTDEISEMGYVIEPQHLWSTLIEKINKNQSPKFFLCEIKRL